jgi:hypothetical protein
LVLRDWRYVVRICNIDVTALTGVSAANLINLLIRGLYRLPTAPVSATTIQTSDTPEVRANMGRTVIYANRVVRTYLDLQAMNKTNVLLRIEEFDGKPITTFRGIPVRTCDAIARMVLSLLAQLAASISTSPWDRPALLALLHSLAACLSPLRSHRVLAQTSSPPETWASATTQR